MIVTLIALLTLILFFATCYLAYQESDDCIFWVGLVVAVIVGIILLVWMKD